jgi:hypothetical protein
LRNYAKQKPGQFAGFFYRSCTNSPRALMSNLCLVSHGKKDARKPWRHALQKTVQTIDPVTPQGTVKALRI